MSRIIIVSNRLPVTIHRTGQRFVFTQSAGGLATGLSSVHAMQETVWIGWPGVLTENPGEMRAITDSLRPNRMLPVFMNEESYSFSYEGFCNSIIWPLFHYFPHPTGDNDYQWQTYQTVNEQFAEAVCQTLRPGDQVWIQDYHLLLLPRMLRQQFPRLTIGFFLHIPFPAPDVFRVLTWRYDLLMGLLGADLLSFHTQEYANNFLLTIRQVLRLDTETNHVLLPSRVVDVTVNPMGIDYEKFAGYATLPAVTDRTTQLGHQLSTTQTILSADRLDYTKGILQRLAAYELLLTEYPLLVGTVTLLLLVSPSREELAPYRALKEQIEEAVGRINSSYHHVNWTPVHYRYQTVDLLQMAVFYNLADVALVTPFRDGMNLIAKEYVASRQDKTGVLILSEMAGAAQELEDALIINPYDIRGMAEAMTQALDMAVPEQIGRMARMQQIVSNHDVRKWATCFSQQLRQAADKREGISIVNSHIDTQPVEQLVPLA